jgi:hypothetical protein
MRTLRVSFRAKPVSAASLSSNVSLLFFLEEEELVVVLEEVQCVRSLESLLSRGGASSISAITALLIFQFADGICQNQNQMKIRLVSKFQE